VLNAGSHTFTIASCSDELIRIVEGVFHTMLETPAEARAGCLATGPDTITAVVRFAGAWQGALVVQCSSDQAKRIARLFTGDEGSDELEAQSLDVLGEMANIVAGNLKVVLPKGTEASLPKVASGHQVPCQNHASCVEIQTQISADNDPLSFLLAEGQPLEAMQLERYSQV